MSALAPAPDYVLCTPSPVDDTEEERASGILVTHQAPSRWKSNRGVVSVVGENVKDKMPLAAGYVLYYVDKIELRGHHLVAWTQIVAWEPF